MTTKIFKLFTLLFVVSFLLVSCNKDEDLTPQTPDPTTNGNTVVTPPNQDNSATVNAFSSATENDSIDCYVPVLPMTFAYEDGTTVTAETEEDLEEIFSAEPYPWDFAYPVNLENPVSGETTTAADEQELLEILTACEEWDDEDGDWEGDGNCDDIDFDFGTLACYDLTFPLAFILQDSSTVSAANEDELFSLFSSGAAIEDFVYPITLTSIEDGSEHVANNESELEVLLEACGDYFDDEDGDLENNPVYLLTLISVGSDNFPAPDCYDYVYPVSAFNQDSVAVTFNNDAEIGAIFDSATEDSYFTDFVYPVTVTVTATGETVTAANTEEVYALLEDCE